MSAHLPNLQELLQLHISLECSDNSTAQYTQGVGIDVLTLHSVDTNTSPQPVKHNLYKKGSTTDTVANHISQ